MGVGWQQPFPLWRHLTRARDWGSELCAGAGGQNLPPSNAAPIKVRITKFLWEVFWLQISIVCNFGDVRQISSRSNKFEFRNFPKFCGK